MCLAIPGRIVELLPERENLALVEVSGVRRKIDVGLLDDVRSHGHELWHRGRREQHLAINAFPWLHP